MPDRSTLLESIAATIADYREDEIEKRSPEHVDRWIKQFDEAAQEQLLVEMDHVLKETYLSRDTVEKFISTVIRSDKLAGADPCSYWKTVDFLRIQQGGASQDELLALFDRVLERECGVQTADCGDGRGPYLYLDDGIFSGNRLKHDLIPWIEAIAPQSCAIEVVVLAVHALGEWYAERALRKAASEAHKTLNLRFWRCITYEDRKSYIGDADVLRPAILPDDARVSEYVAELTAANWPPILRPGTSLGRAKVFSSAQGRSLLELQMLVAGVKIRDMCPNLKENQCSTVGNRRQGVPSADSSGHTTSADRRSSDTSKANVVRDNCFCRSVPQNRILPVIGIVPGGGAQAARQGGSRGVVGQLLTTA